MKEEVECQTRRIRTFRVEAKKLVMKTPNLPKLTNGHNVWQKVLLNIEVNGFCQIVRVEEIQMRKEKHQSKELYLTEKKLREATEELLKIAKKKIEALETDKKNIETLARQNADEIRRLRGEII